MSVAHDKEERKRLRKAMKDATKARNFPHNTCPASRHVHLIADALAKRQKYHMLEEEPEHCAESMLSVLQSLFKARTRLAELEGYWGDPRPIEEQVAEACKKLAEMQQDIPDDFTAAINKNRSKLYWDAPKTTP